MSAGADTVENEPPVYVAALPNAQSPDLAAADPFRAVYAAHFDFVWRCLRGLGVSEAALADAAQEVFVIVHRRLGEFRGDAPLRTWLYAIVRRVASNHRRTERRRGPWEPLDPNLPAAERDPHTALEDREALAFVQAFLAALDEKHRDVFVLHQLEGLSMPEVANILEIPTNTAYTRLRKVRLLFEGAAAKLARHT